MLISLASLLLAAADPAADPAAEPAGAATEAKAPAKLADLDALVTNPPFGSGAPAAPTPAVTATNLELRGMYREGARTFFSLYDTKTKQSRWVAEGEASEDPALPVFKAYDAETGTLTVEVNGKPAQVAMKSASVAKYEPPKAPKAETARGGPALPEPGPDGKVQTPWGNFTPEQIAAYRAERERRWQERMQQVQAEGGDPRRSRGEGRAPDGESRGSRDSRR